MEYKCRVWRAGERRNTCGGRRERGRKSGAKGLSEFEGVTK